MVRTPTPQRARRSTYLPARAVETQETQTRPWSERAALREVREHTAALSRRRASAVPSRAPRTTRRKLWFQAVLMVSVTGLVGTAALPAYASSSDASSANGDARVALAVQTLTSGSATAAVPTASHADFSVIESSVALDSTQSTFVSTSVKDLATKIMGAVAAGRLVGSTPNHIPEIEYLAEGRVVPNCGVDYRVLQAIDVALSTFSTVGVSDINRRCTGQIEGAGVNSPHYANGGGHAVDFYLLNGSPLTGGDALSVKLIHTLDPLVPKGSGLGQAGCRASISLQNFAPFDDTCNHLHMDFGNAQGVALKE